MVVLLPFWLARQSRNILPVNLPQCVSTQYAYTRMECIVKFHAALLVNCMLLSAPDKGGGEAKDEEKGLSAVREIVVGRGGGCRHTRCGGVGRASRRALRTPSRRW